MMCVWGEFLTAQVFPLFLLRWLCVWKIRVVKVIKIKLLFCWLTAVYTSSF